MIQAKVEIFPLAQVFRISRGARTQAEVVTVIYEKDGIIEIKDIQFYKKSPFIMMGLFLKLLLYVNFLHQQTLLEFN